MRIILIVVILLTLNVWCDGKGKKENTPVTRETLKQEQWRRAWPRGLPEVLEVEGEVREWSFVDQFAGKGKGSKYERKDEAALCKVDCHGAIVLEFESFDGKHDYKKSFDLFRNKFSEKDVRYVRDRVKDAQRKATKK